MTEHEFFDRLAELAVRVGVNLQPEQELVVAGDVEHAPLVRALMEAGWRAGAADVQALYREPYDQLFLGRYATDYRLERSSFAGLAMVDHLASGQMAYIATDVGGESDLYADVSPERLARITRVEYWRRRSELGTRGVAWTGIPFPTEAWASRVFGEPDLERLRDAIAHATRLDEPDPVGSWKEHVAELNARADWLTARAYDGLRFRGPGTDLFVGLLPRARWGSAEMETSWGQRYVANIPTEEIATTPDCWRTSGEVTITVPFAEVGAYVADASFQFEEGHVVHASAAQGQEWLTQMLATDEGASLLGEVALVPAGNRLSELGLTYFHLLLDENVASHIAFGQSYADTVPGSDGLTPTEQQAAGMSNSSVHYDFMIGGPEVDVFGVTEDGREEPLMVGGSWHSPS
ncbi:MAG TPA: aminopeptidase [Gaiellaceae bacterium]|nr:aminopeptidase [Gaiellaceae bacterium]